MAIDEVSDGGSAEGARGEAVLHGGLTQYTVAEGDTAAAVAARFDVPPWALIDTNQIPVQAPIAGDIARPLTTSERLHVVGRLRSLAAISLDVLETGDQNEGGDAAGADEWQVPPPHPEFVRHFADELYFDPADELAPFGSDEGSDSRWEILSRTPHLPANTSVASLMVEIGWGDPDTGEADSAESSADLDPFLIGVAFTLLWSTGGIDPDGRTRLIEAIRRQIERYGEHPRLVTMLTDVERLPATRTRPGE